MDILILKMKINQKLVSQQHLCKNEKFSKIGV